MLMKNKSTWSEDLLKKVVMGLELSSSRLLEEKRLRGQKLVVMINGKIEQLTTEEYLTFKKTGQI